MKKFLVHFKDRSVFWPRGKVLGGTSKLNAMVYTRGNKRDYHLWNIMGNEGWSYKDILPYFLKSEDNRNVKLQGDIYHSTGGNLTVEVMPVTGIFKDIMQACQEVYPFNPDYNGEKQSGCVYYQATTRGGLRCGTAKAYIRSVSDRTNLHISANSHVHKILIDPKTKTTTGVVYKKDGKVFNVAISKEVILSAGNISSPQVRKYLYYSSGADRAYLFHGNIRFVNDLYAINDADKFNNSYANIYPQQLELKLEHKG